MKNNYYICPICGKHRFPESGTFDICPHCGWENDDIMNHDPSYVGGANELSQIEFRKRYNYYVKKNTDYHWALNHFPEIPQIKTIRLMLEYNTYCIWLYDEDGEIIDNDNPPEWDDDNQLTDAFMAVSDLYDTFFIDTKHEFRYVGCPDNSTREKLKALIETAVNYLMKKNNGKYIVQNDIACDF